MPHYFLLSGIICLLSVNSYAGNKLPVNARGEAVYKHSFKLQANVKAEDAYNLAQDWFKSGPEVFTCENIADPIDGSGKNKAFVEDAFKNPQPLQSLDPAAGRMAGFATGWSFASASGLWSHPWTELVRITYRAAAEAATTMAARMISR